ncbi:hypothetical protein A3A95_00325 [Candidatus Nomurabacteria bacterium RIFCSPLOWO2_01_FULL_39_18]|uniref:DUF3592 domain-containing protein n=1 Tax=Candidatus Nomurabacteria bacterium RIFCSPHIGHO2_01_FULL_40_24b TaxID=1801739 RepID=A0A1F6V9C4_9BACT|nr:MAG: hypothetical protein A2647_03175 [Candidatus Nomurabacteria bacterium RIFCSPHIGHO2_01_FULL_40_24b]OGI90521.1 MAG: hypothetical protein A3A95_00325 [Candidatus Nomurabacteria bacterium RIFCSPLOWO2_01_FULL_39_18]
MKKLFAILPLFGSLGFFFGAYVSLETAKLSPWAYISVVMFGLCGLAFLLWGFWALLETKDESVSYQDGQALKNSGIKLTANIIHLQQVTNVKINGRSPYIIHARGTNPTTKEEQIFKSFWLWSDPFAEATMGREIDVYIGKYNPLKYYLDVESIGLPSEQTKVNKIVSLAIIIPIIILFAGLIIALVMYQKNKKYINLLEPVQTSLQVFP